MVAKRPTTRKERDELFEARVRRVMEEDEVNRDVALAYIAIEDTGSCADVFVIDENGVKRPDDSKLSLEWLQEIRNAIDRSEEK